MSLTIRALRTATFGFGPGFSASLELNQEYTLQESRINLAVLDKIRTYAAAGKVQVVSSGPRHGFAISRPSTARNQILLILGDDATTSVLPNGSTLHYLSLGGVQFILGNSNIDGTNAASLETAFLAALAASTTFQATGARVASSSVLSTPAEVAATQTLTFAANASNNDPVVIGGQTYTFKTSLTAPTTANEVLIGGSASASLDNLIAAINGAAGGGTTYGSATVANASVTAAAGAGDTMVVTAIVAGTVGNAIATTETFTDVGNVWGAATLAGGLDTRVLVVIDGDDVDDWAAFVAATEVTDVNGDPLGTPLITITALTAVTDDAPATDVPVYVSRTVVAGDVTRGYIALDSGLTNLSTKFAVRITRAGTEIEHNGTVSVIDNRVVRIENNSSVDFEAGDIVQLFAAGAD